MNAYLSLQETNPDAAGWVSIPDTSVSYPVVRGADNEFYLTHDISGRESTHGSIFADADNAADGSDLHLVLYGHNMRDKSMFGTLSLFEDPAYCAAHPIIRLSLRGMQTTWQIFSVCISDDSPVQTEFQNSGDFAVYVRALSENSLYDTGVQVDAAAPVLTLLTCDQNSDSSRFALHAALIG